MVRKHKDNEIKIINGMTFEHSGGIPRAKSEARNLAKELRGGGLLARVIPSSVRKGKWIVYIRKRKGLSFGRMIGFREYLVVSEDEFGKEPELTGSSHSFNQAKNISLDSKKYYSQILKVERVWQRNVPINKIRTV